MIFNSFGTGQVIVTLFDTDIPCYSIRKTFRILQNKAMRPGLKFGKITINNF